MHFRYLFSAGLICLVTFPMTSMAQESIRSRCRPLALLRQCRAERTLLQAPTVPPRLSTSSPFLQQCSSGPTLTLNTIGHRGSVDWSHPLLDTSLQAGAWISNLSQMGGRSTTTAFTFGQTRGYPGQVSACQHGFATNRTRHRLGDLASIRSKSKIFLASDRPRIVPMVSGDA